MEQRELTLAPESVGLRLDRWLAEQCPDLSRSQLQNLIEAGSVTCNGSPLNKKDKLKAGQTILLTLPDPQPIEAQPQNIPLDIVYEDENLLLVNKRPGLVVHADETEKVNTLVHHIQAYLYQKKEWDPAAENSFAPALCNRIDRNTGGIVIAAKNAETLRIINDKIRTHELRKSYLCVTVGAPNPPAGKIEGFLLKDEKKKEVSFYRRPVPGGRTAVTYYKTLQKRDGLALVECELLTGRTHQIRVSMAELGCPLLGDGKYGRGETNRRYHEQKQCLWSYRLAFDYQTDAGALEYLRGKVFSVQNIPFKNRYFP